MVREHSICDHSPAHSEPDPTCVLQCRKAATRLDTHGLPCPLPRHIRASEITQTYYALLLLCLLPGTARSSDFTDPLEPWEEPRRSLRSVLTWLPSQLAPFLPPGMRHAARPHAGAMARWVDCHAPCLRWSSALLCALCLPRPAPRWCLSAGSMHWPLTCMPLAALCCSNRLMALGAAHRSAGSVLRRAPLRARPTARALISAIHEQDGLFSAEGEQMGCDSAASESKEAAGAANGTGAAEAQV